MVELCIQKLKLNNSLTNGVFFSFYSITSCFLKLFFCFAISFAKNRNTKFYHPAKFELKQIKSAKVVPRLQLFGSYGQTLVGVLSNCIVGLF